MFAISSPSVRRNIFANYVSQFYSMGIGIVMAPVYLSFMGTEAYGLIGFFTMMTGWFQLLDLGLTPTLVRETARFRGGVISVDTLRAFLRVLEVIFGAVSIAGAIAMVLLADQIAAKWLKVQELPIADVSHAVMLMGLAVPLRWVSGLYRGVINGFELQVWLGGYNVFIATARFIGVLAVFTFLGATPVEFFAYQLVIAGVELGGLLWMTHRIVQRGEGPREKFSWKPLLANLKFALAIAFAGTVWVVATQTDKLVLSKLLTLSEYGVFSIAVVAAGAINSLGGPPGQALLPRLTKLVAEGNETQAATLYRDVTQAVLALVVPGVAMLVFFAEPILLAWTGKFDVAHRAAPILCVYAIGNGCSALGAIAYYMQYARGDLRLHFIGSAAMVVTLIPLLIVGAALRGALGAGIAWAAVNALYVIGWMPVVHARVFKRQHLKWMMFDVIPIVIPTLLVAWLFTWFVSWPKDRWGIVAIAVGLGAILTAIAGCGSSLLRTKAMHFVPRTILRISKERP